MTIKDIQVNVDNDAACSKRVKMAVNLAATMDAHLTGVHVRRTFPFPAYSVVPTTVDVDMVAIYNEALDDQEANARKVFKEAIGVGNTKVSWHTLRGSISYELASSARYSDLLLIGQPNPKEATSLNDGITDEIIMSAGRPCLLLPYETNSVGFGTSPLIAWDGSRESGRAVHDAMPFLKQAGKATILIVNPEKSDTDFEDLPGAMISEHLARHDIDVTVEVSRNSPLNTGDTILAYAADNQHDLIIMGAYGHSRWREIVLGGATRTVMKHMQVPVLVSH